MIKKGVVLLLVVIGLVTFFLPLVRLQAPLVGTQRISGWDVVKPGEEKKPKRDDLGLNQVLAQLQGDFLRRKKQEAPASVRQAQALVVTLPLAYLALVLGGVLGVLARPRALQVTAAVGLLAGVYSLISVFWLSGGVKEMVAATGRGSGIPLLGRITRRVAQQVEVGPELGLYLLAGALALLLLASFLPGEKR